MHALGGKVKARGAPATAVHVRDIVKQVYAFAILHGEKVDNPADGVGAASIATFVPKDRALSPMEIRLMYRQMESVATYPTIRLALRMIVLTLGKRLAVSSCCPPSCKRAWHPSITLGGHHGTKQKNTAVTPQRAA